MDEKATVNTERKGQKPEIRVDSSTCEQTVTPDTARVKRQ